LKKKSRKTLKNESRNMVKTDTTSWCLLNKPAYRQLFRGRRRFNYTKRFCYSMKRASSEIRTLIDNYLPSDRHSSLTSSLQPSLHLPFLTFDALAKVQKLGSTFALFFPVKSFLGPTFNFLPHREPKNEKS